LPRGYGVAPSLVDSGMKAPPILTAREADTTRHLSAAR
jgi:hypothetical protein